MAKLPSAKYSSWIGYTKAAFPGVFICFILAVAARFLDKITPANIPLNYVLYAILFGMIIRNIFFVPKFLEEGFNFSSKILLFMGVIFVGGTLDLLDIAGTGAWSLALVSFTIASVLLLSSVIGKLLGIEPQARHLIGTGISVCGVSAVMALSPIIKAKEKTILVTVATILLIDVFALIGLPIFIKYAKLSEVFGGYLAGSVVGNTAQSIATGLAIGDTAGVIATITKTARNALMAFVILFFAYYYTKRGLPVGAKVEMRLVWDKFPKFVLGFLLLSLCTSLGFWGKEVVSSFGVLSKWFFTASFVGIGSGIDLRDLNISDFKPVLLGFVMVALLFVIAFFFIRIVIHV